MSQFLERLRQRFFSQEVTVFPTYAYRDPATPSVWKMPLRIWVHDNRDTPFVEDFLDRMAARHFEEDLQRPLTPEERARLEVTVAPFIADDKTNEEVEFSFVHDPHARVFRFTERTTPSGMVEETFTLPEELVQEVQARAGEAWLPIRARTTDGHGVGEGGVRVLPPRGLSVVSDIDDTIKVTHVPAGKQTVLRNTFLKPFQAAPEMLPRYRQLQAEASPGEDVCFHYVSGSPWQLQHLLSEFLLRQEGFPSGTFHLKSVRFNLLEPGAFSSLRAFALGGDLATLDQKIRQITNLMLHLPERRFILIGDSGEKDPEVYRAIQRLFPQQVERIIIRDVLGERLKGMERIGGEEVAVALDTSALEAEMAQLVANATALEAPGPRL